MRILFLILVTVFSLGTSTIRGQKNLLLRQTIGKGTVSSTATLGKKIVQQSFGQSSVIGTFSNSNVTVRQGFIQGYNLSSRALTNILVVNAKIYPNPFNEWINISFEEGIDTDVEIVINDVLGKTIFVNRFESFQYIQLNLSELINATYFINIYANNKIFKTSIIKI